MQIKNIVIAKKYYWNLLALFSVYKIITFITFLPVPTNSDKKYRLVGGIREKFGKRNVWTILQYLGADINCLVK